MFYYFGISFQSLLTSSSNIRCLLNCSLLCLSPASVELTREFCEQLDGLVGPQLTLLASDICEQFTINRRISGSVDNGMFDGLF